ncbi:MAG: AAA family ATPase [Bacteroidota bacterium]|nr:AAA family ATPase [Bacteroidota bacterium]
MELLFEQFVYKLRSIDYRHKRFLYDVIDWNRNPVVIKGAHFVGKSNLALQFVKQNYKINTQVLYVAADHIYFSQNSLGGFAENFAKQGGKHLFIDDIHKYDGWHEEIEQVLRNYGNLKLVLIGSSVEDYEKNSYIKEKSAIYELPILSLREYIHFSSGVDIPKVSFGDILKNHVEISLEITQKVDPTAYMDSYMRYGGYPSFTKDSSGLLTQLAEKFNRFIESDLTQVGGVDFQNLKKIKQLILFLATDHSDKLNITDLSKLVNATRGTVLQYLELLRKGRIISLYKERGKESGVMTKADSVFINNTNLLYTFSAQFKKCLIQKTFFQHQLSVSQEVYYSQQADFEVSGILFDILCKESFYQKKFNEQSKIYAVDSIEIGVENSIPLWLFGFMY